MGKNVVVKKSQTAGVTPPSPGPNNSPPNSVDAQVRNIINSLANPVLSAGYNLNPNRAPVLKELVVKTAVEILERPRSSVTVSSPNNPKYKLKTYSHPTYQGQAGVYVVRNVEDGTVIVGQSSDIQNRGEQYLVRGSSLLAGNAIKAISAAFEKSVLALLGTGKQVRQVFECLMVERWPKVAATSSLTSGVTLTDQNEINYVEALLTYVFQNLGLSLNTVIVPPTNTTSMPQAMTTPAPNPNALQPSRQMGKACIVGGQIFYSLIDYATWSYQEKNTTINRTRMRKKLDTGTSNGDPNNHWLTQAEIDKAIANNSFVQYKKQISIS